MDIPFDPNTRLDPGDLVEFIYQVPAPDDPETQAAISDAKRALAADPRWDYQGMTTEGDGHTLKLYVMIRKTPKSGAVLGTDPRTGETIIVQPGQEQEVQQAGLQVIFFVLAVTIAAVASSLWPASHMYRMYLDRQNVIKHPVLSVVERTSWPLAIVAAAVVVYLVFRGSR